MQYLHRKSAKYRKYLISIIFLWVLIALLIYGCKNNNDNNSNEVKRILQGKWISRENDWGLIFEENKVYEYENGEIQNEGEYILDLNINPIKLTILEDKKEQAAYIIEFDNSQTLKVEEVGMKNKKSFSEEYIILIRQKGD